MIRDLEEMTCMEFVEQVTAYLEGALPAQDRERLEQHLAVCEPCRVYLEQLRMTLALAGRIQPEDLTSEMRTQLLHVFTQWKASG
jgi:anti-sigma factor RsiW